MFALTLDQELHVNISILVHYPNQLIKAFIPESFLPIHIFHADERFYVYVLSVSGLGLVCFMGLLR